MTALKSAYLDYDEEKSFLDKSMNKQKPKTTKAK